MAKSAANKRSSPRTATASASKRSKPLAAKKGRATSRPAQSGTRALKKVKKTAPARTTKATSAKATAAKLSRKAITKKVVKKVTPKKTAKPAKAASAAPKRTTIAKAASRAESVRIKAVAVKPHNGKPANHLKVSHARGRYNNNHVAAGKDRLIGSQPLHPEPATVPDSRVATNLKPRKNQAGLGVRDLESFRVLLLEKRREILGDMSSMENEALGWGDGGLSTMPVHMADMGTDNYEQEFTLGLVEKDRMLLGEINHALAKIQNGAYGICEGTGDPIGKPRLQVQPWARYGIEFARQRERHGMGIR